MESSDELNRPRVLVTNCPPLEHFAPLAGVADLEFGSSNLLPMSRDEVLRSAHCFDAIINQGELRVDAELLDAACRVKVVANVAVGTDNLDKQLMADRGVWASNCPDAFVDSTADATLALALALLRKVAAGDRYVRSGKWETDGFRPGVWDGIGLRGKVWGVVGFGKIGQAVGRRAEAFGCHVIACRRSADADGRYRTLDRLLPEADVVSLHVPLEEATRGMIDRRALSVMKPTAVLINMARGPVVVEDDLLAALEENRIAGAALDVLENEPRCNSRLLQRENVVFTPHLGGGTHESRRDARLQCARNVANVLTGRPPETPVNKPDRVACH